jgi:hypothetical protein
MERRQRELERRRVALNAQIVALQHEIKTIEEDARTTSAQFTGELQAIERAREAIAERRGKDAKGK